MILDDCLQNENVTCVNLWSKWYSTEWLLTDFEFTFDRLATHSLQPSTNFATILIPTLIDCSDWSRITFIDTISVETWSQFHKALDSIDFWLTANDYLVPTDSD